MRVASEGRMPSPRAPWGRRCLALFGLAACAILLFRAASAQGAKTLDVYFVDVEGGQAIVFVTPGGESLLLDSGGDFDSDGEPLSRDADRVIDVAKAAGLKRLDYFLVTHYHQDHVAAVPRIAAALPIGTFLDHGAQRGAELEGERGGRVYRDYVATRATGRHTEMRAGDRIQLAGNVQLTAVAAAAKPLTKPLGLRGANTPNPLCAEFVRRPDDPTMAASLAAENASSLATAVSFGQFSLLNLGDLVWNQEFDLVCPRNLIGEVSVLVTPIHGISLAGSRTLVHALRPRIAVWNNGAMKGSREPIDVVRSSPGFEDLWQLHYLLSRPAIRPMGEAVAPGGAANNAPDDFIANVTGKDGGVPPNASMMTPLHNGPSASYIKLSASEDGSFSVTNSRNGFTKRYAASRRN